MKKEYTVAEHQHRLAAWVAGHASSVKECRFTVQQAKGFLQTAGFVAQFTTPTALRAPADMDRTHRSAVFHRDENLCQHWERSLPCPCCMPITLRRLPMAGWRF